jgi:hypothetical protein
MTDFTENDADIRSEDPIGSNVTLPSQTAGLKVAVVEFDGIPIPNGATGYLASDKVQDFPEKGCRQDI